MQTFATYASFYNKYIQIWIIIVWCLKRNQRGQTFLTLSDYGEIKVKVYFWNCLKTGPGVINTTIYVNSPIWLVIPCDWNFFIHLKLDLYVLIYLNLSKRHSWINRLLIIDRTYPGSFSVNWSRNNMKKQFSRYVVMFRKFLKYLTDPV